MAGGLLAKAGTIDEKLVSQLNQAPPHEHVTGLVMLTEQLDLRELEAAMAGAGIGARADRHRTVLEAARSLARRTQAPILEALRSRTAGEVAGWRSYWITNMIEVTARPEVFTALALRPEVGLMLAEQPVELRAFGPQPAGGAVPRARSLPDGLLAINAPSAWDRGYTGEGRLVCSFDTGADGAHPAYAERWRGAEPGVPWYHCWRDPYTGSQFPYDAETHGTHVLGIMTAAPPGEDPLGVAYGSRWIAAGTLIGWNVQRIIEAYEWAADPDSNFATIDDVPDVINNSWGTPDDCASTFWNAIDVVEAAGIVNVISVDNRGPAPASVNSPESRADGPYRNFSVGNVDPHEPGYPIFYSSGRGPSPCDMTSIKPELTAPGTLIRSTMPNGLYGERTGTSQAAPHVSGAAAILRQVNPELTVEQVKEAILATAADLGAAGEDNDYGHGILDVGAAVDYVLANYPHIAPPRDLGGEAAGDSVLLSWLEPLDVSPENPLAGYRIYRTLSGIPFPPEPIAEIGPGNPSYVDPDLPNGDYRYRVTAVYADQGESNPSNVVEITVAPPAAVGESAAAGSSSLSVRPNPIRDGVWISLAAGGNRPLTIEVIDAAGRRVAELARVTSSRPGSYDTHWDGTDASGRPLPAGAYFIRAREGEATSISRLVVLR